MKRRRGSGKRGKKRRALGPKVLRAPTARVLKSIYPFAETIERLKKDIAAKGIRFFSEIDQTKLAADAGIKLDPSTLLVHSPAQFDRLKRERDEALGSAGGNLRGLARHLQLAGRAGARVPNNT